MKWKTGAYYEGDWFENMMQGEGKLTTANNEVFEGKFHMDKASGLGKYINALGDIYEGYLVDGVPHGDGT